MVDRVRLDGYNGVKQNLLKKKLFKLKLLIKNMENMKKLLFLLMVAFACFQVNAEDYSTKNYIEQWGRLKIVGKQVCSESGQPVQLKGWSTFGLQWETECYSFEAFKIMKYWGANSVRLAMYVKEGGFESNRSGMISRVKEFIDFTSELGIYCVVDWHILNTCGNPEQTLNQSMGGQGAEYFFTEIANYVKQKDYIHVIYELCNEPNQCQWSNIKTYAEKVIPVIQGIDKGALMIVGTPDWCQKINDAASNPITIEGSEYLLYSFHYYACSHQHFLPSLRSAATSIPVVVSEWGAVNFDGNQRFENNEFVICTQPSDQLLSVCDGDNGSNLKISWWYWNWGDKHEGSSSIKENKCYDIGKDFGEDDLASSGRYILTKLCGDGNCSTPVPSTAGPYQGRPQVIPTPDGGYFELAYYDEGGPGVAYYDGNGDSTKSGNYETTVNCNACFQYDTTFVFREGECVDVSKCAGVEKTDGGNFMYRNYNIGHIEPNEWMKYTVKVEEPGYYSFKYLANTATAGSMAVTLEKPLKSGGMQPLGNCLFESGTTNEIESVLFTKNRNGASCSVSWECWAWVDPIGAEDPTVLFKEAGEFTITILFLDEGSDVGSFRFTKAASYSGEGYPEPSEDPSVGLSDAASADFVIYPNPTTGEINIDLADADEAEVNIINVMGQIVYSSTIESGAKINAGLVKGTYIVTVKTANSVAQQKLVVE